MLVVLEHEVLIPLSQMFTPKPDIGTKLHTIVESAS